MKPILYAIATFLFIYLIAVFINWDFNASHWNMAARGFVGIFGAMFSIMLFMFYNQNK